jgi:preprotein translocase subunit SecD
VNTNKKLKLLLIVLVCILVILIGFFGIYKREGNAYKNLVPDFLLSSDLKGSTTLELEVDKSTNKEYYDKDGNKVDSSTVTDENKDEYTEKEVPVNDEEQLNQENYEKVVKIIEKRLKFLSTDQYRIDLDKTSGKIIITFEDEYADDIKSIVPLEGSLELIDETTEDVVLNYADFKSAEATYASLDEGYTIYLSLKLNDNGIEKIKNIDKYKNTKETTEEGEESTESKLKVMFDTDQVASVSYDDILLTGSTLRITTGSNVTNTSTLQSQMNMNTVVAKLASIGKMPVVYKLTAEEFITPSRNVDYVVYGIYAFIVICVICAIIFILKYKINAIFMLLSFIANIAATSLIIKLTKVSISINILPTITAFFILNIVLIKNILQNIKEENNISKAFKNGFLKTLDLFVITLIIFIVFAFTNMAVLNSLGLLLFWGWLNTIISNFIFALPMLYLTNN